MWEIWKAKNKQLLKLLLFVCVHMCEGGLGMKPRTAYILGKRVLYCWAIPQPYGWNSILLFKNCWGQDIITDLESTDLGVRHNHVLPLSLPRVWSWAISSAMNGRWSPCQSGWATRVLWANEWDSTLQSIRITCSSGWKTISLRMKSKLFSFSKEEKKKVCKWNHVRYHYGAPGATQVLSWELVSVWDSL